MNGKKIQFSVIVADEVLAKGMEIDTALTLVEGLFTKYYNEPDMKVTIAREVTE